MTRYVAFLRAVNVGKRTVAMARARQALEELGYEDVASFVNSGNLIFTSTGSATSHEAAIRKALEDIYGFEITTFVRSAAQVRSLATDKPFGELEAGHTHFALLTLKPLDSAQQASVEALTNDHDVVRVVGRDVHWLIRSRSTETTLGPKQWRDALPNMPTTARNTTMLGKLVTRL